MKNIKMLFTVLLMLTLTIGVTSCLDDDDNNWQQIVATFRVVDDSDYFFEIENKGKIEKMHPGDRNNPKRPDLPDGQRVIVYFELLEEKVPGYEYNAKIYGINEILTKNIIPITEATNDSIGNDPIDIVNSRISLDKEFIHMSFQYNHIRYSQTKHMLNLVIDEESPEDEYINLEFRHNGYDELGPDVAVGLVTFRLDKVEEQLENKKGIRITYKSINSGNKVVELSLSEETQVKPETRMGVETIK